MEFGRRLAVERELEKTIAFSLPNAREQEQQSSNRICFKMRIFSFFCIAYCIVRRFGNKFGD